jgi:hypothetical protein
VPALGSDDASSISEVSAVSCSSANGDDDNNDDDHVSSPAWATTATSDQRASSELVLETTEQCGLTRHYLLPRTAALRSASVRKALRARGAVKLHVVPEKGHVFVAKHVKR